MNDSFVQEFVRHNYHFQPVDAEALYAGPSAGRALYRLEDGAGDLWMLRLRWQEQTVPSWYGGGKADEWLGERAGLLTWLAQCGYPVPQLMRTQAQTAVGSYENWCGILMSYVAGTPLDRLNNSGRNLHLLAAALGRLHEMDSARQPPLAINSWWHPLDQAVRYALQQLASLAEVPREWQALSAALEATLRKLAQTPPLPITCVHGDCWRGNAIHGVGGQVQLIDWDAAGLGAAILDFGALLGDCFLYPAPEIMPDIEWIRAVVDGYLRYRTPTAAELDLLPEAVRFGPAFRGAIRFSLAQQGGWPAGVVRGLKHEQARLQVSAQIAELALAHINGQWGQG